MLDAIDVIAQYARDQAVVSARDRALARVSPRLMDHGQHIHVFVWSLRRTVSSYRITILRLPDDYNRRTCLQQLWAGLVSTACMCRRADMYSITIIIIIISYKFKILNNKEKPPTTGKLNQWWKQRQLSNCMILNCTSLNKKKRTQTRKLKRFLSKSKGCRVVKSTTGPQCKLTRNKHGMVTRLTC